MAKQIEFATSGTTRKAQIKIKGYAPFDIEFEVPTPHQLRMTMLVLPKEISENIGTNEMAAIEMAIAVAGKYLRSWSLPEECTAESIELITDNKIPLAIFTEICKTAGQQKN